MQNLPGPLKVTASSPLDGISVSGSQVSLVVGTRISTPFFGTGFNFCVGAAPPLATNLQPLTMCLLVRAPIHSCSCKPSTPSELLCNTYECADPQP